LVPRILHLIPASVAVRLVYRKTVVFTDEYTTLKSWTTLNSYQ